MMVSLPFEQSFIFKKVMTARKKTNRVQISLKTRLFIFLQIWDRKTELEFYPSLEFEELQKIALNSRKETSFFRKKTKYQEKKQQFSQKLSKKTSNLPETLGKRKKELIFQIN